MKQKVRVAILDLYEGQANEGMRCIRDILERMVDTVGLNLQVDEYDVRQKCNLPGLDHDIYISTGGPGSPIDSKGLPWDTAYFNWLASVESWNEDGNNIRKKYVFFICHSFQLACRHFRVAKLAKRKSTALGVFPIHMLNQGQSESVFQGLNDPFYGVDSRDYQVIQPDMGMIQNTGAELLCLEKERPHVDLERAIMAIRFNPYMIGTQFHPEADAAGMSTYLLQEEKKKTVIENHGHAKWQSMIDQLKDPDKIILTNRMILPNFIIQSAGALQHPFSLS